MSDQEPDYGAEIIDMLLGMSEDEYLDFKRVGNVKSILKTACALANSEGGAIILGVSDAGQETGTDRFYGLDENPEAIGEIQRGFQEGITPPLGSPDSQLPEILEIPCRLRDGTTGKVAAYWIPKSDTVHSYNNATYIRAGSQSRQIGAQEIHRLCLKRGVQSYVNEPVDVPVELLVTQWWEKYASQRQLTREAAEAMKHVGLMVKTESGQWQPTVAAVLLFAEEPNGLLNRKCSIRIFHYRGHAIEYGPNPNLAKRPVTISGPILSQIEQATRTIGDELNSGAQRVEGGFEFPQTYPVGVIQEAITNAVLHRDYSLPGDVQIRIFTNRIEVESPGVFPGAVTPENIGEIGSRPRNPKLTDHVREFPNPPNLDAGEGVRMMKQTLKTSGLYPPVFEEIERQDGQSVLVRLSNEAKLSEWDLVEDHLRSHETISNSQLRHILNLKPRDSVKASRLLKGWVDSGHLEIANPSAGTRKRQYRRREKPRSLLEELSLATSRENKRLYLARSKPSLLTLLAQAGESEEDDS